MKYFLDKSELTSKIVSGINKLADNVAATMGPCGRNVILQQHGKNPIITKDGVTVSRFVELDDCFENACVAAVKQAAEETNTHAGDGTTTSIVLARALFTAAQPYLAAGAAPVELKRGMDEALAALVSALRQSAKPISKLEELRQIATISANNDELIGGVIAEAIDVVGKDGAILVKEGRQVKTELSFLEGFTFRSGLAASIFADNERTGSLKYEKPLLLVTDEKLTLVATLMPALEIAAREKRPLVIIAEDIAEQALASLIVNSTKGILKVVAIKAPAFGSERQACLEDLACAVGATFMTRTTDNDIGQIKLSDFGTCETIESNKFMTTIIGGAFEPEELSVRIDSLKSDIRQTDDLHKCEKLQERITRLASGVALIHVGGNTEIEMIETKHRIEDALAAVLSAQEEGIVAGGGVALLNARKALVGLQTSPIRQHGVAIVQKACEAPLRQMVANADGKPDLIVEKIVNSRSAEKGFNIVTGKFVDMLEDGIIDPVKVTRIALQNAISVIGTLITTSHAIVEETSA